MRHALLASAVPLVLLALFARSAPAGEPSSAVTEHEIRAHLDFLASDLLEGRDSGYRGGEVAAAYLEAQLALRGFRPLFESFQMPFELRGAAGRAKVRLSTGDEERTDAHQIEALSASGLGDVRGPLATGDADPSGKIVLAAEGEDADKSLETATDLFARGARAVVFVSTKERFEVRSRRDGRRRSTPKPKVDAAPEAGDSKPSDLYPSAPVPPVPASGPPTSVPPAGPSGSGGGYLTATDAYLATHAMAVEAVLTGPAVRVSRDLGPALIALADAASEIELAVSREGVDKSTNVIGWMQGSDPTLRDEYVVIGAHYDHVGFDDQGNIWNGTDDNGSGTVAVLEVADALGQMSAPPKRSVVVCFWGAEERGLVGSMAFVRSKKLDPTRIAAYVNLDMVSRNDSRSIFGLHVSDDLFDLAVRSGAAHGLEVAKGADTFLNASDSGPFIQESVPTFFFFCGLHDQYHTPADDPGTVDYGKITLVARTACDMLLTLADSSTRPQFQEAKTLRTDGDDRRRLGIFPDGESKEEGVTVRAVSGKSVAAKAGLRAADRILKVGDKPVKDMASMREALAAQAEGTAFPIEIVRDGKPVTIEAKFEPKTEEAKKP